MLRIETFDIIVKSQIFLEQYPGVAVTRKISILFIFWLYTLPTTRYGKRHYLVNS